MQDRDRPARSSAHASRAADALRRIVQALRISAAAAERETGLSSAQLLVLRIVGAHPGLSLSRVMERTLTDLSSVSVVVRRLTSRGLVERRTSERDGRRAELHATPAGRRLLRTAPRPAQEPLLAALRAMPPADGRRLADLLAAVAGRMGAGGQRPRLFFETRRAARTAS